MENNPFSIVALVGRRDEPTDGVEDYCVCLGKALGRHGVGIELVRVPWAERGWIAAALWLGRQSARWKKHYVLVQYTALGWSRRGFPFGLLPMLFLLRCRHVSFGEVFHDAAAYPGTRFVDRIRRATQQFVMKIMAVNADRVIMPANSENLTWLTCERSKVVFMPVGSNIPAPSDWINNTVRVKVNGRDRPRTIAVFGITDGKERREKEIASNPRNDAGCRNADFRRVRLLCFWPGSERSRTRTSPSSRNGKLKLNNCRFARLAPGRRDR